jgi:hypothetical protein
LVGAAIGRFRLARRSPRWPLVISGWIPAILVHVSFNGVVLAAAVGEQLRVLGAVVIGFGGLTVTALFIFLGLREQRQWLVESLDQHMVDLVNADLTPQEREWLADTLDQEAGVTVAEVRASQAYEALEDVLDPIAKQFPRKAELMERIVLQQAQIGIKRRVLDELDDDAMKRQLAHEIARRREDTKRLRREAGLCAMTYLQCVFDPQDNQVSRCLEQWMACDTSQGGDEAGAGAGCSAERQSDRASTADATSG